MPTAMKNKIRAFVAEKHRVIFWVVIPLCFFVFSFCIIGLFAQHMLKNRAWHEVDNTIGVIDSVLNDANDTASQALTLLGRPCDTVVEKLRVMGMQHSLVRTVDLLHQRRVYCAPIPSLQNIEIINLPVSDSEQAADIEFRSGTSLFFGQTVLVLHKPQGENGVAVVIDMRYMLHLLNMIDTDNNTSMTIKDLYLTSDGKLLPLSSMAKGFISVKRSSATFPYQIHISISFQHYLQYLINTYGLVMILSVIVCVVMSLLIRKWLKVASSIRSNMAQGLKRNEFEPYFQPVMDAASNTCIGVEILTRWQHPADGVVSPDVFIPLAEESGLIIPLTKQLMQRVAFVVANTPIQLLDNFYVAINISAQHLSDQRIVGDCEAFLSVVREKNIKLVLELTERQLIEINDTTLGVLDALQLLGIGIAIDDFGTGYSGLSYLRKLKIDFLKIDQSFVAMIEEETTSRIIVDVVIDLANKLNMKLIAEGVENVRQRDYLLEKLVVYQQGYYFARPMPINQFTPYFEQL
ncbi:EAL domain-containing protein [Acerihabitans sp. TG2]|uniref:EAL domain-containing protein n=1 Tax=Acerihabitans sp. TG2 TaxID=3096008 RepID=UPI002B22EF35|nr:EAL domain-containing protein [Acerihabitans sp. TG2]MEA9390495.1 EAL domain-containing protein [Acerihabitans sp. TG2]